MTYPQNFEEKIGFDKIRRLISDRCLSTLGSERVADMKFQTSFDIIEPLLRETEEFTHLLQNDEEFPADHYFDIRPSLQRIRIEGTFLDENRALQPAPLVRDHTRYCRFFHLRRRRRKPL